MVGAMTINEIREKEDIDPIEGGDEHFVPLNMIPLSMVKEQFKKKLETSSTEPIPQKKPGNGQGKEPVRVSV
jgi:hypothetical protein